MKRLLDSRSLRALARGCAVLGAGGGGDTYLALLQALQAIGDFGEIGDVECQQFGPAEGTGKKPRASRARAVARKARVSFSAA